MILSNVVDAQYFIGTIKERKWGMSTQPIRLAIVDDNAEMIDMMSQRLQELDTIELVGTANDVEKGLSLVRSIKVDVVLVDLVMPGNDGFYMLEELERLRPNKPICIMVSALNAPHIISRAAELGADHFVLKPFDMDQLFKRITEISRYKNQNVVESRPPARRADDFIQGILDGLPLSHALMGYRYIRTAARMCIEDPSMLDAITKQLYPQIAAKHKSSPTRVERAIRHAIHTVWRREGGAARFAELMGFPVDEEKPTNSHFIASIVGRYRYFYPEDESV